MIRATPHTAKSSDTRPNDVHRNRKRDPSGWNLDEKPSMLLMFLSFAVDEHCKVEKNLAFCVCSTAAVVENAHMEAGGIELTGKNLWDHRSC